MAKQAQTATAVASGFSRSSIQSLAETLSRELRYARDKNISRIVAQLGGKIKVVDPWIEKNKSGSLFVQPGGKFEIVIPEHTTVERDNFTIAHELGHYVVHYLLLNSHSKSGFEAARYGTGRAEWEANWFASAFLMPKSEFKDKYSKLSGSVGDIARHFRVSDSAARVRAKALGLIE